MNRLFFIIVSFIIVGSSFAQSDRAINIYTNEGHSMLFLSDIDSITHNLDDIVIYLNHKKSVIPIIEIDSLAFSSNSDPSFFPITEEGLEGWTEGYMNNDGCFIVCRQENDGGYFAFLGQKGIESSGIALRFDDNMTIQSIFTDKGAMNVFMGEDNRKYAIYLMQDSLYIEELTQTQQESSKYNARRIAASSALNIVCNWANYALTAGDFANLLSNGSGYLTTFLGNLIPSFMGLPSYGSLGLSLGLSYLEKMYENHFYDLLHDYMGSPMIWISDIDENNAPNYRIEVSVQGLNTFGKPISCSVHTGIAVRINESNVTYDNCDNHLNDHGTNKDEVYYADLKAERKQHYYLRPYAVVMVDGLGGRFPLTRSKYLWGGPKEPIITYGDVDKIYYDLNPSAITGECINVTDKSATVKCSFNDAKDFKCGVTVTGNGKTLDVSTSSFNGEREINISGLSPATTYNYCAYVNVDGEVINGETKSFTTKDREIPDLTGTWTFNQTYLGAKTVTMNLKLKDKGSNWATYTASGFYGVITFSCTVHSNRSVSLSLNALNGAHGAFSGTFDETFTSVSGDSYLYVPDNNNWAVSPWTVNDPWTFSR